MHLRGRGFAQARGFAHGQRKKYAMPKNKEQATIEKFRTHDETELLNLLRALRTAVISCAETLQYEASALPAKQVGVADRPEKLTQ